MRPIHVGTSDASGGTKNSNPAVIDYYGIDGLSVQAIVTGTATYTIQQTLDNPLEVGATVTWFNSPDANLVTQTVNRQAAYSLHPVAIRIQQTAGTGSVRLTVLQMGPAGGS